MKLTRKKLRKLILETINDDIRYAEQIAGLLREAGEDYEYIRQYYELAVGVNLAQPNTLKIVDLSTSGRHGSIISFVATDILKGEIMMAFDRVSSKPISETNLYEVTYFL